MHFFNDTSHSRFSYSTLDDFRVVWSAIVTSLRDLFWSCVGSNWGSTHFVNTEKKVVHNLEIKTWSYSSAVVRLFSTDRLCA